MASIKLSPGKKIELINDLDYGSDIYVAPIVTSLECVEPSRFNIAAIFT